jgi:hypothetical protein
MANKILNDLARDYVGDGKSPNLYFVTSDRGTTDKEIAIEYAQIVSRTDNECLVEDRKHGEVWTPKYGENRF